jgi:hypothetical protein
MACGALVIVGEHLRWHGDMSEIEDVRHDPGMTGNPEVLHAHPRCATFLPPSFTTIGSSSAGSAEQWKLWV